MGCAASTGPRPVSASVEAVLKKWCAAGLAQGRNLKNASEIVKVQEIADDILSASASVEEMKAVTFPKSKEFSVLLLTGILLADSALKLKASPTHHLTIIHAMYNEQERIKPFSEDSDGQDFVSSKVKQMQWLYGKYGGESTWNYIAVDDGCPNESGKLMEEVVKSNDLQNVEVVYLQTGIDSKEPPFDQMQTTKDSRKGGSILYGLHCARKLDTGKKHIAAYFDADLSADVGMSGLLVHPILVEGKKVTVGQRYGCTGSFLALPAGADSHPESLWNNSDCFLMMFRHFARGILMPALKGVYDTQCAFKAIEVDRLGEILPKVGAFGSGFDMELLIMASEVYGDCSPLGLVPFLFVEDKEGSTMTSNDEAALKSFHSMLKEMVKIHERCFGDAALSDEEKAWIKFFRDVDLDGYHKLIAGYRAKLGPQPAEALDYKFDLREGLCG